MKKNRELWPDAVKAIAIFLVVATHGLAIPPELKNNIFVIAIYAVLPTCVPLFVMASGALLLPKKESSAFFFKKRLLKILPPWIFWISLYTLISLVLGEQRIPTDGAIHFLIQQFLSRLWFLPLIFYLYLLTPFFRKFIQKFNASIVTSLVLIWFIVVVLKLALDVVNKGGFNALLVVQFFGYYLGGYLLTKIKPSKFILFISFTGATLMPFASSYLYINLPDPVRAYVLSYASPMTVFTTFLIFILINQLINLNVFKFSLKIKGFVHLLGVTAFGIYLTHELVSRIYMYIFEDFRQFIQASNPIISTAITIFAVFSLSFIFTLILRKNSLLKCIVP